MGFGNEFADFAEGLKGGLDTGSKWQDRRAERDRKRRPTDADTAGQPGFGFGSSEVPQVDAGGGGTASIGKGQVAWNEASPEQKALLNAIAGKESAGAYDVIYGGGRFKDFSKHPGQAVGIVSGPNKGKTSSAAGKYQFLGSTWNDVANRHGLTDFSPANQDKGAWYLAADTYGRTTGRSLDADLKSKDPSVIAGIGKALRGTWTSLPGGIEQGQNEDQFVSAYNQYLQQAAGPTQTAEASYAGGGAIPEPETTRFAAAGVVPVPTTEINGAAAPGSRTIAAPTADPWSTTRGYSQPKIGYTPHTAGSVGGPRQVAMPGAMPTVPLVNGMTPSQIAFDKILHPAVAKPAVVAPKPVVAKPVVAKPATTPNRGAGSGGGYTGGRDHDPSGGGPTPAPPGAPQGATGIRGTSGYHMPGSSNYYETNNSGDHWKGNGPRKPTAEQQKASVVGSPEWFKNNPKNLPRTQQILAQKAKADAGPPKLSKGNPYAPGSGASVKWEVSHGNKAFAPQKGQKVGYSSPRWEQGGVVSMAEGGVIPEPEEDATMFAGGGKISFDELLKQEKGNRDQAAKRFNAQDGGPTSSAYGGSKKSGKRAKAHDPDGYFTKAPKGSGKTDKTKTASTKDSSEKNASYPYGGDTGTQEYSELAPEELSTTPSELSRIPDPALSLSGVPADLGGPGNSITGETKPFLERGVLAATHAVGDFINGSPEASAVVGDPGPAPQGPGGMAAVLNPEMEGPAIPDGGVPPPEQGAWLNGQWIPANAPAQPMLGYAEGGVIPDDGGPMMYADAGQGRQAVFGGDDDDEEEDVPAERPDKSYANVRATPKLLEHVRGAIKSGGNFITQTFNMNGGSGAVDTPEDAQASDDGARRFAMGEGATTPEEIKQIDDVVDPERSLSEGDRQMVRMAKTYSWYMEQGREDDAKMAAGSLMQYGAQRFGQISSLAATAYRHYQETGDPKDLNNTVRFMEEAYHLIPDGANVDIAVDPKQGLFVTRTSPDGEKEQIAVSPEELPALLKSGMDKSMYWKSVMSMADPGMARQKESQDFQREMKTEGREYEEGQEAETRAYTEGQEEKKYGRDRTDKAADAKLAAEAEIAKEERAAARSKDEKLLAAGIDAAKPEKLGAGEVDMATVGPVLGAFQAADAAYQKDPENQELVAARNEAASRFADAVKNDPKQMEAVGLTGPGAYTYSKVTQAAVAPDQVPPDVKQDSKGRYWKAGPDGVYNIPANPKGG